MFINGLQLFTVTLFILNRPHPSAAVPNYTNLTYQNHLKWLFLHTRVWILFTLLLNTPNEPHSCKVPLFCRFHFWVLTLPRTYEIFVTVSVTPLIYLPLSETSTPNSHLPKTIHENVLNFQKPRRINILNGIFTLHFYNLLLFHKS